MKATITVKIEGPGDSAEQKLDTFLKKVQRAAQIVFTPSMPLSLIERVEDCRQKLNALAEDDEVSEDVFDYHTELLNLLSALVDKMESSQ